MINVMVKLKDDNETYICISEPFLERQTPTGVEPLDDDKYDEYFNNYRKTHILLANWKTGEIKNVLIENLTKVVFNERTSME